MTSGVQTSVEVYPQDTSKSSLHGKINTNQASHGFLKIKYDPSKASNRPYTVLNAKFKPDDVYHDEPVKEWFEYPDECAIIDQIEDNTSNSSTRGTDSSASHSNLSDSYLSNAIPKVIANVQNFEFREKSTLMSPTSSFLNKCSPPCSAQSSKSSKNFITPTRTIPSNKIGSAGSRTSTTSSKSSDYIPGFHTARRAELRALLDRQKGGNADSSKSRHNITSSSLLLKTGPTKQPDSPLTTPPSNRSHSSKTRLSNEFKNTSSPDIKSSSQCDNSNFSSPQTNDYLESDDYEHGDSVYCSPVSSTVSCEISQTITSSTDDKLNSNSLVNNDHLPDNDLETDLAPKIVNGSNILVIPATVASETSLKLKTCNDSKPNMDSNSELSSETLPYELATHIKAPHSIAHDAAYNNLYFPIIDAGAMGLYSSNTNPQCPVTVRIPKARFAKRSKAFYKQPRTFGKASYPSLCSNDGNSCDLNTLNYFGLSPYFANQIGFGSYSYNPFINREMGNDPNWQNQYPYNYQNMKYASVEAKPRALETSNKYTCDDNAYSKNLNPEAISYVPTNESPIIKPTISMNKAIDTEQNQVKEKKPKFGSQRIKRQYTRISSQLKPGNLIILNTQAGPVFKSYFCPESKRVNCNLAKLEVNRFATTQTVDWDQFARETFGSGAKGTLNRTLSPNKNLIFLTRSGTCVHSTEYARAVVNVCVDYSGRKFALVEFD